MSYAPGGGGGGGGGAGYSPYSGGTRAGYPPGYPPGYPGGYPGGYPSYPGGGPPQPYGQPAPAGFNINLNQPSGYPPYPGTQPGYPGNPQPSYPANPQPSYPVNPQPSYPVNPQPSYPVNPQHGYPGNPPPTYPANPQPCYPPVSQPGYPPITQSGYPPVTQPGYPPVTQPGYPPTTQPGYPLAAQSGYPSQPSGYPGSLPAGYPGSQISGYPGSQSSGQSPYPSGATPACPGQPSGVPSQSSGFPGRSSVFPSQSSGFPGQPGGYPSQPSRSTAKSGGFSGQQTFSRSSVLGLSPSGGHGAVFKPGNTWYLAKLQGTIRAAPGFDAASDAHALRKAMKGLGTDEKAIIEVLCKRNNAQRQQISVQYKSGYGRDLIKDLKSELGGKFENVILGLMMPPYEYLAQQLYKAMDGVGTDEDVLFETLCTHSNAEIRAIRDTFQRMYHRNLENDVVKETSGHFRKVLVALLQANRDESGQVDQAKAANQAQALYKAGEKKMGTDEETFNVILVTQNPGQIQAIMAEYEKLSKKGLIKAIESETSGDYRHALLAIVKSSLNRTAYFAERLYDTMKGMGTRDNDLIRLIICRAEYDLANIKQEYLKLYGKTLEKAVSSETSGDYKRALVSIIEGN